MGYYIGSSSNFEIQELSESEEEDECFYRSRKRQKSYYVNFEEDDVYDTSPFHLKKGQRITKKMANSLDSSTLVNIAKNRSRLLKLADGIRTRKKPGSSKKSLKLDPAYTNIEHLVFGTYRARSATPDSRHANHNQHIKDCSSTNSTPTRNDHCQNSGHFPRRVPYRSSDGSESERSSTVSSTDAKCECNRHSPSLVILSNKTDESANSSFPREGGCAISSSSVTDFGSTAGEKATKGDEEKNFHVATTTIDQIGGGGVSYSTTSAPRADGWRISNDSGSFAPASEFCVETETGFERAAPRRDSPSIGSNMPSSTSANLDLRRGPCTTPTNRSASGASSNNNNKINSHSAKELKVQNGSSSSSCSGGRNKIRKALSAEESQTVGSSQHLSASSSGVSRSSGGCGEDSGYQTSNGSSRRTSWKELASNNSPTKISSSHSDSKLQSRTRNDNSAANRLNGLTYGAELSWCKPEQPSVPSSETVSGIKSTNTQFERQNSCPSGIPKAKQTPQVPPHVRLALLTQQDTNKDDCVTPTTVSEINTVTTKSIVKDSVPTSEDSTVGTQTKNAASTAGLLRKGGSLPERSGTSKIRYPGMVTGGRNQSFRKATESVDADCAVPDLTESDKLNVTCKIRITPPQTNRGNNMKGNLSRQISSTGNYKNLISGSAIQAGSKQSVKDLSKSGQTKGGNTSSSVKNSVSTSSNATRNSLNGSKSNLNGSKNSLNGSKRDLSNLNAKATKGSSYGVKNVPSNSPKSRNNAQPAATGVKVQDDVDKCSSVAMSEMNRSVKSVRPQQMIKDGTQHHQSTTSMAFSTTVNEQQNKTKSFGLQNSVQKGERQKRPRQQVPVKEPNGTAKNNMARWADIRGRNIEKSIPDSLTKFVPAEDTHVPAPEPFSLPECNVTTGAKIPITTTWAQLGKSRSIDAKSTPTSPKDTSDNCYVPEVRRSSLSGEYYSLDSGSSHLQKDCAIETVVEPIPRRASVPEVCNVEELNQVETETKVVNGVTGIPIPRNKMIDVKAIRVMVPMPLPYRLNNKDGPSSLPVACDEEPSFEIMNETIIGAKIEPSLTKEKPPLPPPSPKTNGQTFAQTPPIVGRKRSLSVGSPARHLDLRLLAAFQRYGDAAKELPENPEGCMSDIEEKDENSSSSASRATSEEPQECFVDGDWSLLGGHRVSVVNGTVYRSSPIRRRTTGSLGLERLLPIGPPITPTSSWKGTPSSSPGRDSLSSRDNISVIQCNFDDDSSVCSSAKSTPARRNIYRNFTGPFHLSSDLEHSQNQSTWEKTVTIETGPTNSHLVVGTTGEEIAPLVQMRHQQNGASASDTYGQNSSTIPPVTPYSSLPPSSYRLIRNRPISRSERHLKTTSTPEFRAGSVEAIGGGSVRDVRRPWSEVYGEELDTRTILSQTNPNCFSVPNFPRFGDGSGSPSPDTGGNSFFNRFSSIRATDSMLQKFRKTFSLRFQKTRKEALNNSPPAAQGTSATPVTSTPVEETPPPLEVDQPEVELLPSPQPPPLPVTEPPYDKEASFTSSLPASECSVASVSSVTTGAEDSNPNSRPESTVETELGSLWNLQNVMVTSPPNVSGTSPGTLGTDATKDDGLFKLGLSVLRSSRDRKKLRKKDCRSSKCNSADSGIQVEGTCPGDGGVTEPNSATESPAVLRRRAVSTSESPKNKVSDRPLSDYIDHIDLESVDEVTSLGGGKSVGDVFRESSTSPRSRDNLYCSPVRRTPSSIDRQMSTPPPIKLRPERKIRPRIRRQKGKSRLRRSISQPLDLEKMGFAHKGLEHGLSDHEGSRESTASSDEDFSSDNELFHILKSPNRKQNILKEMYEDTVTYAEALWDHVTIDIEELPFKAGEVIEVTDTSDKDWWWGSIGGRSGWFPAPFVRLRVSQEDTVEDCIIKMADGTLTSRNHAPRKMSISLLSNEQVRANVVREIVTTERDFVQHLRDVVEGYLRQVRRRPDMFSDEVISTIFGNIEAIYSFQSVFLKNLEACINWQAPHISEIGQCFLDHKESFKIYSEYCNNHPLAVSQLQELYSDQKYVQFFEACRLLQDMIDISLDGFLLTPVQKICKYPLQLAELLKYTKPDHPDHRTVTDALAAMRGVAQMVNERKRRMECLEKLVEWQKSIEGWEGPDILETSSVLIHSGEVTRVTSNWSRDITLFLFDHLLVYCKKDLLKRSTAVYKGRIDLNHCCVFDVEDGKDAQFGITLRNAWKIHCSKRDKWFLFYAKSPMEKSRWLQALREERQLGLEDKEQGFIVTNQAKKAAKLAVLNKNKTKRPRAKIPKGSRPHPDTAVVELLLLDPPGPKTRSGSLPSNLSPSMVVNGSHARVMPTKKKGSGWFHFGSGKKSKK